jgi:hypothetical protein
VLSFLFPSFFIEFFLVGILFEIFEYFVRDCHDVSDILYNLAGIATGVMFSTSMTYFVKEEDDEDPALTANKVSTPTT